MSALLLLHFPPHNREGELHYEGRSPPYAFTLGVDRPAVEFDELAND